MKPTAIFACRDARGPHWQLGPLPPAHGRLTLIGWSQQPEQHDAGVPEDVARVLARSLTSVARVTFPSSVVRPSATTVWSHVADDLTRVLDTGHIISRVGAKLRGRPAAIALTSTRQPDTALHLFDDTGFPWWMQGQVVLLSGAETPPPDIDSDALFALFEAEWTESASSLAAAGIAGIMRPGVDGDVAGLLSLTDAFESVVLAALERETLRAGLEWSLLSEDALAPK